MAPRLHHWSARFLSIIAVGVTLFGAHSAVVSTSHESVPATLLRRPTTSLLPIPKEVASTLPATTQPELPRSMAHPPNGAAEPTSSPFLWTPTRPMIPIDEARPLCGVALCVHHIGDLDLYLRSIDTVHSMGANALELVTPMFQYTTDSHSIRFDPDRCPSPAQLIALLRHAHELGMHTTLLPIVLLERRGSGDWRGVISPKDWDRWWISYQAFIDTFVDIANAAEVDLLCVGSELNSAQGQLERWRALIAHVRARFDGQLTYSANWDRYRDVPFWNELDVMSVSSYFTLTDNRDGATLDELVAGWRPHRDALLEFAASKERPLILSELGYPSLRWAGNQPWNYVAPREERADHEMQARCFEAFFRAWTSPLLSRGSSVAGFQIYHWDPYRRGGSDDVRYGVDGKPARGVIERHFRILRDGVPALESR